MNSQKSKNRQIVKKAKVQKSKTLTEIGRNNLTEIRRNTVLATKIETELATEIETRRANCKMRHAKNHAQSQTGNRDNPKSEISRTCAAIFDLDGTIIDNSSERTFVRYLFSKFEIPFTNLTSWTGHLLKTLNLRAGKENKVYLRGKEYKKIYSLAEKCFNELLINHISPKAMDVIQFHKESGHMVILLSGSLEIFANLFKNYISMDLALGNRLEVTDGIITGKTKNLHPVGKNKAILLKQLATQYNLDLSNSYAYGNHYSDAYKLNLTKYPVAVNPDRKLRRIANKKGWKIEKFH